MSHFTVRAFKAYRSLKLKLKVILALDAGLRRCLHCSCLFWSSPRNHDIDKLLYCSDSCNKAWHRHYAEIAAEYENG